MQEPRLEQVDAERQDALIAEVLERALDAGQQSVRRGPDLLPVLREAGVVDAGGYGLTVIFAGVVAALRGTEAPELDHHAPARVTHPQHESSTLPLLHELRRHRRGPRAVATGSRRSRRSATRCWSSATRATLKVHVHTDEPERATGLFAGAGAVSRLDVADMHEQVQAARRRGCARADRRLRRASPSSRARGWRDLFSVARRDAAAGRPDAEPVDLRAARRHPRRARPRRSSCCRTRRTC